MAVILYVVLFSRESAADISKATENPEEFAGQAE